MSPEAQAALETTATSSEPIDEHERACWVAFNRVPGIGVVRFRQLLDRFGSLAAAWAAPRHELALAGLDRRALDALNALRSTLDPGRELDRVRRLKADVVTWRDAAYPRLLAEIADPPPVLYVRGRLEDAQALAMVGTRRATIYGRDIAERLAADLARAGLTIVSGLARGIDTHAHRGALQGGGRTIAVLGHGIDTCYPPENRRLAEEIVERGALLSDYPVGTGPAGENFPPRNRIISGLSAGVLVVEAGEHSGALITSRYAAEQGRDAFAVPGPITSAASRGCHQLIQEGAKLVTSPEDVLQELNPHLAALAARQLRLDFAAPVDGAATAAVGVGAGAGAGPTEGDLLARLHELGGEAHVDHLARASGRPVHEVSAELALLELQGRVRHAGGMRYALAH
jgi:DNA processing protein